MDKKQILIGGAWPYANNSMHIGHLAALLPGDVIGRYFRKKGADVLYVSGSDCHGTPITVRADKLGVGAKTIASHYDEEFRQNFLDLGFQYDLYTNTMNPFHQKKVQEYILKMKENGYLYEKETDEDYCESCKKFVADREIIGICPICGAETNGDQCDKCLTALTPDMILNKKCKKCGQSTIIKKNKHIYFKLSALQDKVQAYVDKNKDNWRPTAINETNKYLEQGLKDRAITRDLNWGIPVPFEGYESKRLYVWIEAVMGYLTAGEQAADSLNIDFSKFIRNPEMVSYYIHGKDNIVFHTIILPALIMAIDDSMNKPNMIVSCEYINVNDEKMSKSKGNLTTVNTLLENFDSDTIRYFFTLNNPERKDASFILDDFISTHNKMIVGGYGNFVNRNLSFLAKKFDGVLPKLQLDKEVEEETKKAYDKIGELIEKGELKTAALESYFYVQFANKYYDKNTPWVLANTDKNQFDKITSNCIYMIVNISNIFEPFMPKTSKKVKALLNIQDSQWAPVSYDSNVKLNEVSILFNRIDPVNVDMTKGTKDTLKN